MRIKLQGGSCCNGPICKKTSNHISEIESKVYKDVVDGVNISFTFELVPSDMKWIAFFAGELNNAAHYFSTFANVNADDKNLVGGSFGNSPSDTWQPWEYNQRLKVANEKNLFDLVLQHL